MSTLLRPASLAKAIFAHLERRDLDGLMPLLHPDVEDDFVALQSVRGRAAVRRVFEEMFRAFPDMRVSPVAFLGGDEHATVQWRMRATFCGSAFDGIEPTHRPIDLRGVDVMRFERGLLVANTVYMDGAAFARQVGLLPPTGSSPERLMRVLFNRVTRLRHRLTPPNVSMASSAASSGT